MRCIHDNGRAAGLISTPSEANTLLGGICLDAKMILEWSQEEYGCFMYEA